MTIVCIVDCLLVMIFREYISISEVKEVIKFKHNPYKIGKAAVPPILAGSAALWKLIRFQPILAGLRGSFSSTYSFSGPRPNSLLLSQPTPVLLFSSLSSTRRRRSS